VIKDELRDKMTALTSRLKHYQSLRLNLVTAESVLCVPEVSMCKVCLQRWADQPIICRAHERIVQSEALKAVTVTVCMRCCRQLHWLWWQFLRVWGWDVCHLFDLSWDCFTDLSVRLCHRTCSCVLAEAGRFHISLTLNMYLSQPINKPSAWDESMRSQWSFVWVDCDMLRCARVCVCVSVITVINGESKSSQAF
jgi:hypothetical protein